MPSRIHQVVVTGSIGEVQKLLLTEPREVDAPDEEGSTPLHLAISHGGSLDIIRLLLRSRANIEAQDKRGWRPLHTACFEGTPDICDLLLDAGAQPHALTLDSTSPLHYLVRHGSLQRQHLERLVSRLASGGGVASPINLQTRGGDTPLHSAVLKNSLLGVQVLLKNRALPNIPNGFRDTPLHMAARERQYEIAAALLQAGANPDTPGQEGTARAIASKLNDQTFLSLIDDPSRIFRLTGPTGSSVGAAVGGGVPLSSSHPGPVGPMVMPMSSMMPMSSSLGMSSSSSLSSPSSSSSSSPGMMPGDPHSEAYRRFLSTSRGQEELARLEAITREGEFIAYAPDPRDTSGSQLPLLSTEPSIRVAEYMICPSYRSASRSSSSAKTTTMTQLTINNYMAQLAAVQSYRQIQPRQHMALPATWMSQPLLPTQQLQQQQQQQQQLFQPEQQQLFQPEQQQQQQPFPLAHSEPEPEPQLSAAAIRMASEQLLSRGRKQASQSEIAAGMMRRTAKDKEREAEAERLRLAQEQEKEMQEAADKARRAQEAAEQARRAVAEAQEARARFEREAEERRAEERRAEERRAEEKRAEEQRARERELRVREMRDREVLASKSAPPAVGHQRPPPSQQQQQQGGAPDNSFSALTSAISNGLSLIGGFQRTPVVSSSAGPDFHAPARSAAAQAADGDSDSDSRDISSDEEIGGHDAAALVDPKYSTVVLQQPPVTESSSIDSWQRTATASDSESDEEEDESDWEQSEVDRYTRQLTEVSNWLVLELNKKRVKTAQQLSDALREQAKPFLDTYGRRNDLRGARELVMKLHEVLKRYDVEVEGAEEQLGLEAFIKGRGSYAETVGRNTRRRVIDDSDESDSSEISSRSDDDSDDEDDLGGFGASYSGI